VAYFRHYFGSEIKIDLYLVCLQAHHALEMALYFRSLLLLSLVSEANEGKEIENEIKTQPLEMTFMTSVFG